MSGAEPQAEIEFGAFLPKNPSSGGNNFNVFRKSLTYNFSVAPLLGRGVPGARGPWFIEPPEPPVPTPLLHFNIFFC